jgi:hypothetical protein
MAVGWAAAQALERMQQSYTFIEQVSSKLFKNPREVSNRSTDFKNPS